MRRVTALIVLTGALVGLGTATPASANTVCPDGKVLRQKTSTVYSYRARTLTADVVVYGDSITFQSTDWLPATYGIDAQWGRQTTPTVDRLKYDLGLRTAPPKVVVMAIGSNDRVDPSVMAYQVRRARVLVPATTRLVWVNVYAEHDLAGSEAINDAIVNSGATRPIELVNWYKRNSLLAAQNGGMSPLLDSSGTHLNCRGGLTRGYAIKQQVMYTAPTT